MEKNKVELEVELAIEEIIEKLSNFTFFNAIKSINFVEEKLEFIKENNGMTK